jgi:hypothetical protein
LALLHCHRIVFPLTFGGGRDGTDDWSLDDWCGQCHRKGGLVVWTDAFSHAVGLGGEALADLILGRVDAIEWDPDSYRRMRPWYHLLNLGLRVPLAGASAKVDNSRALGAVRTYARLPGGQPYSLALWIEAVRAGRTFVTEGPAVRFTVDGGGPGASLARTAHGPGLAVRAEVEGTDPIRWIEVVANGEIIGRGPSPLTLSHPLPAGGWLAARVWAPGRLVAHTSPVYVSVAGTSPPVPPAAIDFLLTHLDRTREWIETQGRFEKPKSRAHLLGVIDDARQQVLARAGSSGTIAGT